MNEIAANRRLLVVDDVEANRYILALWLRRAGYDVVEATDGAEAIVCIAQQPFDLVLLDVNLPDMSGYDVCEMIKANRETALTPVLHVSASATAASNRAEGLRRGAEGYLVEPVEREELLATVEALLRASISQKISNRLARKLRVLNDAAIEVSEAASVEKLIEAVSYQGSILFEETVVACIATDTEGFLAVCAFGGSPVLAKVPTRSVPALCEALSSDNGPSMNAIAAFLPAGVFLEDQAFTVADLSKHPEYFGTLAVGAAAFQYEETDVVLAQYARGVSSAMRSMHLHDIERGVAIVLQKALLPDTLPTLTGYDLSVRYEASALHAEVGGDFYEIFSLDDDNVAIAIGDVMGHSLEAATIMAQLRTAFRSYGLEGHSPAHILERLNRLLLRFYPKTTATVICGFLNLSTGRCELANAGHLPPLVAGSARARFIDSRGSLLGIAGLDAPAEMFVIEPGETLILYTDGLIERRGENIDVGLERIAALAKESAGSANDLCEALLSLVDIGSLDDDVALMAIRRAASSDGL